MRQMHHSFPIQSCDLTECKLHRVIDEQGKPHFMISYPVEWDTAMEAQQPNNRKEITKVRMFNVLKWEEVELVGTIKS